MSAGNTKEYVYVGKIIKAYGLQGKVIVQSFGKDAENLRPDKFVWCDENRLTINFVSQYKEIFRVGFKEVTSRDDADTLIRKEIAVLRESLAELQNDDYYVFDLIGCAVKTKDGLSAGVVVDVVDNPGNDLLKIENNDQHCLIPMVKEIVLEIDIDNRVIYVDPIEGLFEF